MYQSLHCVCQALLACTRAPGCVMLALSGQLKAYHPSTDMGSKSLVTEWMWMWMWCSHTH